MLPEYRILRCQLHSLTLLSALVRDRSPPFTELRTRARFVSTDGGVIWHKSDLPGSGARVRAIATSLHHAEVAYVSYDHLALDGKTWMGVAKTTNSGRDWQLVWKESEAAATNVHDAWITERFGPAGGESAQPYRGRSGSESGLRYRSGPHDAHHAMAARPGRPCTRAR